jgi:hypothetical protein
MTAGETWSALISVIMLIALIALYLTPTLVASRREKRNFGAIAVLNLFLGWTFIGWVIALVWACTTDSVTHA